MEITHEELVEAAQAMALELELLRRRTVRLMADNARLTAELDQHRTAHD